MRIKITAIVVALVALIALCGCSATGGAAGNSGGGGSGGAYSSGPSYTVTNEHYYNGAIHEYDVKTNAPYTQKNVTAVCKAVEYQKDTAQFVKFPFRGKAMHGAWCMMPHTVYGAKALLMFAGGHGNADMPNNNAIAKSLKTGQPFVNTY